MKIYFAPLEGVTGYIYRRAHWKYYGGADKYFTPFLSPTKNKAMTYRERNDILPEHNGGLTVPQILTNQAEYFVDTVKELQSYGYTEVNLNLGCPSKTVTTKRKGFRIPCVSGRTEPVSGEMFCEHRHCDIGKDENWGKQRR